MITLIHVIANSTCSIIISIYMYTYILICIYYCYYCYYYAVQGSRCFAVDSSSRVIDGLE